MEIDYKKYDLTELRESAREYIRILDTIDWNLTTTTIAKLGNEQYPIIDVANMAVTRLHNAMDAIDRNAVIEVLSKYDDFSTNDPTVWVNSVKTALEDLRKTIKCKKHIAKCIDRNLELVRTYCKEMADWLGQLLAIVIEHKRAFYAAPTVQEKIWLEDLKTWYIEDWLDEYIFIKDISIIYKKRLLTLALKTDDIDEKKLKRLNEVLAQIENKDLTNKQIIKTTAITTIEVGKQALINDDAKERMKLLLKTTNILNQRIERFITNPQIIVPKDIAKAYYNELKLEGTGVQLKTFVESCLDFVGKRNIRGWNYNNIKNFDKRKLT